MTGVGPLDASPAAAAPRAIENASGATPALDDTAEGAADSAATLAQEFSKRATLALLVQEAHLQDAQLRLDRMKSDFNQAQEERSEMLRESNALRDMALEQAKKDDEVLKKYIAMI